MHKCIGLHCKGTDYRWSKKEKKNSPEKWINTYDCLGNKLQWDHNVAKDQNSGIRVG